MQSAATSDQNCQKRYQSKKKNNNPDPFLNELGNSDDKRFDHPDRQIDNASEDDESNQKPQNIYGYRYHGLTSIPR